MVDFRAFSTGLTHCRLHYILDESNVNFGYVKLYDIDIPKEKWLNYLQTVETLSSEDPDQTPPFAASDLVLY